MTTIITLLIILFPTFSFAETTSPTQQPAMNYYEKMSYVKGYEIGKTTREMLPNINLEKLIKGLDDSIYDKTPELDKNQERAIKIDFASQQHGDNKQQESPKKIDFVKLSYALGLDIGRDTKKILTAIDFSKLTQGVTDGHHNSPAVLSPDDQKHFLKALAAIRHRNRQQGDTLDSNRTREESFLRQNSKKTGVVTTNNGLQYLKIKEGTGARPTKLDRVKVTFTASLIDGKNFDSTETRGSPTVFHLNNIIKGLKEGILLMPIGSEYILFIPSNLGYGPKGAGTLLPPYSTLIYDIKLLAIEDKPLPTKLISPLEAAACSFDTYKNAGKCFLKLWLHIKPVSGQEELEEMCLGATTKEFYPRCLSLFNRRVGDIGMLKTQSAGFGSIQVDTTDDQKNSMTISLHERLVSSNKKRHERKRTFFIQTKKTNNRWMISDCSIKKELLPPEPNT